MADKLPHRYQSSRFTGGNRLFPDKLEIHEDHVRFLKRHLIGSEEETIRFEQIASVSVQRGVIFADLLFETTGGSEAIFLTGLWKGTATRAKAELDTHLVRRPSSEERMLELLEEQNQLLRTLVKRLSA